MKIFRVLQIALLAELSLSSFSLAQMPAASGPSLAPHLLLTLQDFEARKAIVQQEPWAKTAFEALLKEADGYPHDKAGRRDSLPTPFCAPTEYFKMNGRTKINSIRDTA